MRLYRYALLACLAVTFTGCPEDEPNPTPQQDAIQADATTDAGGDGTTTPDAVPDATPDAVPDAAPDAVPDATPDAVPDATPDAVPDADPETTGDATTGDATTGDATGDATTGDATTGDATTPDGTTGDATTPDGTTGDATTPDGTTGDATTPDGTTGDATTPDGTTGDATTPDGTTGDAGTPDGTSDAGTPDGSATGCASVGGDCSLGADAGAGWVCVEDYDTDADGICRVACTPATQDVDCGANELCASPDGTAAGFCVPDSCSGFYGTDCGAGANCLVIGSTSACIFAGPGADGEACTFSEECQPGLICLASTCAAPECSADNTTAPCPNAGETCAPYSIGPDQADIGSCASGCDPFGANTCAGGQFCNWIGVNDTTGELLGDCADSGGGTANLGESCEVDACLDGLVCIDGDGDGTPECNTLCNPGAQSSSDPGFCSTAGELCLPLFDPNSGAQLFFGFCNDACAPFQSPDPCPSGQWCSPNALNANVGECVDDVGTVALGGSCGAGGECCEATQAPGCGDATIEACVCAADPFCCSTSFDDTCVGIAADQCSAQCTPGADQTCEAGGICVANTCEEVCDPDAASGQDGACGTGNVCAGLSSGGTSLDIGLCTASCDFHANQACASAGDACIPEAFTGAGFDLCITLDPATFTAGPVAYGAACPAGAEFGQYCADSAFCDDTTGSLVCTQACSTSEGAFGTAADCLSGTCTDIGFSADFGLCQ